MARFEHEGGLLDIEIDHGDVKPLRFRDPLAKMLDEGIELFVGIPCPGKMHEGPELVGELSFLPAVRGRRVRFVGELRLCIPVQLHKGSTCCQYNRGRWSYSERSL